MSHLCEQFLNRLVGGEFTYVWCQSSSYQTFVYLHYCASNENFSYTLESKDTSSSRTLN